MQVNWEFKNEEIDGVSDNHGVNSTFPRSWAGRDRYDQRHMRAVSRYAAGSGSRLLRMDERLGQPEGRKDYGLPRCVQQEHRDH